MKKNKKSKKISISSSPQKQEEGIIKYLKKFFRWQTITGVITVITFILLIYDHCSPDEIKSIKDNIKTEISILEKELNLDPLPARIDTLPDIIMIKEFQKYTLDACTFWKNRETDSPYFDFIPDEFDKLNIIDTVYFVNDEYFKAIGRSIGTMGHIYRYASEKGISRYNAFDLNKHLNLFMMIQEKVKIREQYIERCQKYLPQNKEKAKQILDELKSDPKYYEFDIVYFKTVHEVNNIYKMAVRNYVFEENLPY